MNALDLMFLIQFAGVIGLALVKLYNVMILGLDEKEQEKRFFPMNLKLSFITFFLILICFFLGFVIFMRRLEEVAFLVMFNFEKGVTILTIAFLLEEIFFSIRASADTTIKAYQSNELKNNVNRGLRGL